MRILVTGASGLLGRAVVEACQAGQHEVLGLAHTRAKPPLIALDLTSTPDLEVQLATFQPEAIIHCAAERRPDVVEGNPEASRALNVEVPATLARLASALNVESVKGAPLLINISTDYVFDGTRPPYGTLDEPNPLNAYGSSKWAGERAVLEHGVKGRAVNWRVPVLYGRTEQNSESAVNCLLDTLAPRDTRLNMDACAVRYPTSVTDVSRALVSLCTLWHSSLSSSSSDDAGVMEVPTTLHFSAREAMTKYDMCNVLARVQRSLNEPNCETTHLEPVYEPSAHDTTRPRHVKLDCSETQKLGVDITCTPFEEWWTPYLEELAVVAREQRAIEAEERRKVEEAERQRQAEELKKEEERLRIAAEKREKEAEERRIKEEEERTRREEEERVKREEEERARKEQEERDRVAREEEERLAKEKEEEERQKAEEEKRKAEEERQAAIEAGTAEAEAVATDEPASTQATQDSAQEVEEATSAEPTAAGGGAASIRSQTSSARAVSPGPTPGSPNPSFNSLRARPTPPATSGRTSPTPSLPPNTLSASLLSVSQQGAAELGDASESGTTVSAPSATVHGDSNGAAEAEAEGQDAGTSTSSSAEALDPLAPRANEATRQPSASTQSNVGGSRHTSDIFPPAAMPRDGPGLSVTMPHRDGDDSDSYGQPSPREATSSHFAGLGYGEVTYGLASEQSERNERAKVDQKALAASREAARKVDVPVIARPWFVVRVGDPQKKGDPVMGHIVYTVRTKTSATTFRSQQFSVLRRYSDFRWLHAALVHNNPGVFIPPVPEKVKIGRFAPELVEARRRGLENCINKIANHALLQDDEDLRLFLQSEQFAADVKLRDIRKGPVPTPEQKTYFGWSSSMSGPKFHETDEWFDVQRAYLDNLELHLKQLVKAVSVVSQQRREVAATTAELSHMLLILSGSSLSRSLSTCFAGLGEVERRTCELTDQQAEADVRELGSVLYEYERIVGSIRKAFATRVDVWQAWYKADEEARKQRLKHDKLGREGRISSDRLHMSLQDVAEAEGKALSLKRDFDLVGLKCKDEMNRFDQEKVEDITKAVDAWLQGMIERQQEIMGEWEQYNALLSRQSGAQAAQQRVTSSGAPPPQHIANMNSPKVRQDQQSFQQQQQQRQQQPLQQQRQPQHQHQHQQQQPIAHPSSSGPAPNF